MPSFLQIFSFDFAQHAVIAMLLITIFCGLLSPIVVLKQRAYLSDTLSHLIFPGVVAGILWAHYSNLPIWTALFVGAIVTAFLGTFLLEWFLKILKIPSDASAIIGLTSFVAVGIIAISSNPNIRISPESILFGDILTLSITNIWIIGTVTILAFLSIFCFKKHWDAWLADAEFAQVIGFKVHLLDKIFPVLLTLSVLSGIFAVGGFMISALITIPAVIYQPRSVFSPVLVLISICFGIFGVLSSFYFNWPVGPTVVLLGFIVVVLKALYLQVFSPNKLR